VTRVGLLGCGNMGMFVAEAILQGEVEAELVAAADVVETEGMCELAATHGADVQISRDPSELRAADVDVVLEVAHPSAVEEHAVPLVESGKDLIIMSIGGLIEESTFTGLEKAAIRADRRVILPAGSITALRTVQAANVLGGVSRVQLMTTKAPRSLKGAPHFVDNPVDWAALTEPVCVFSGNVREAIKGFPQNVNVAAAVALAGIGSSETAVEIHADPEISRTRHVLHVEGEFGELQAELNLLPRPDNPRSAYLAALSALSAIDKYERPIQMGY